jgi:hypothetical protein
VKTTSKVDAKSRGKAGGKVMRKKEPVLLVLSVCDGEIILEKGEILFEKRHAHQPSNLNFILTSERRI